MKLSDIIKNGLGPCDRLNNNATVVIGELIFNLAEHDPEINIYRVEGNQFTYHHSEYGYYDWLTGYWVNDPSLLSFNQTAQQFKM